MKIYFLLGLLALNSANAITEIVNTSDKKEILALIDHTCADTWCSGDYEFKFQTFSCNDNSGVCTLTFKIIDRDEKPGMLGIRNRRCIFKGLTSKEKIYHEHTLSEEFYDQLNYCVSNRETN
jgi:hypothetical protein